MKLITTMKETKNKNLINNSLINLIQTIETLDWNVTIYEDEVTGWKRTLQHPETEVPGAYAVGVDSTVFLACGGDWIGGARSYQQIYPKIDQEENEC